MEKDIGKIKKNDSTEIIVRIDDFGGKKGLTIREYTTSERYTGFTKSGTRIPAESFKVFKEIINSIDEEDLKVISNESVEPIEPINESMVNLGDSLETTEIQKPKRKKKKEIVTPQEDLL